MYGDTENAHDGACRRKATFTLSTLEEKGSNSGSNPQPDWVSPASPAPRYEVHTRSRSSWPKLVPVWWGWDGIFLVQDKKKTFSAQILSSHKFHPRHQRRPTAPCSLSFDSAHSSQKVAVYDGKHLSCPFPPVLFIFFFSPTIHLMIPLHSQTCSEFYC